MEKYRKYFFNSKDKSSFRQSVEVKSSHILESSLSLSIVYILYTVYSIHIKMENLRQCALPSSVCAKTVLHFLNILYFM